MIKRMYIVPFEQGKANVIVSPGKIKMFEKIFAGIGPSRRFRDAKDFGGPLLDRTFDL